MLDRAVSVVGGADGWPLARRAPAPLPLPPSRRATRSNAAPGPKRRRSTPRPANTPFTEAITHFARAVGAARSGNPAAAASDIEKLAELRDKLKSMQDAYWTEQVDLQRRVASAWPRLPKVGKTLASPS